MPGGIDNFQKMSQSERHAFVEEAIKTGTMPKVTFCCGAVVTGDDLRIYYGAGDSVICTAVGKMSAILNLIN